jgi:DNA-binding transcriptional MerR regulator
MGGNSVGQDQRLDQEWVGLMKEAKNLGISIQEIREFIEKEKTQEVLK